MRRGAAGAGGCAAGAGLPAPRRRLSIIDARLRCAACLTLWLIGTLALPGASRAAACEPLTRLDPESLATFEFESATGAWQTVPDDAEYRLGEITVIRQDVFESRDNWLQRLANRYHTRTRERVVRSVLPMRSGDRVDGRLLAEAERILRGKVYFYDARLIPRRRCGDVLDIYVVTRDVWTLLPRLSVTRAGGENDLGVGLSDINLLGSGKSLLLGYDRDEDRRGWTFAFSDPNIADSRWAGDLVVVDNDDGERFAASLRRPFFALDARNAFRLDLDDFRRDEGLYYLSDEIWEYQADSRIVRAARGWSTGLQDGFVHRFLVGYGYEDHRFELPVALTAAHPAIEAPDRRFGYPFFAVERIEDDFDKRVNLDRVQRTEDIALGQRVYAELGYSPDALGGAGDHLIGRFSYADAAWLTERQLVTFRTALSGYYDLDAGMSENLIGEVRAAYRYQHAPSWSLLVRADAAATRNTTLDRQLLLGGAEGLRGYPTRYQIGDRRVLLTVEERFYADVYPWQMFRLGTALFVDVGRAWYEGEAPDWLPGERDAGYFGVLSNAGIGLRLESTRTRRDLILHLDFAVPFRSGPEVRDVEITLTAKQTL